MVTRLVITFLQAHLHVAFWAGESRIRGFFLFRDKRTEVFKSPGKVVRYTFLCGRVASDREFSPAVRSSYLFLRIESLQFFNWVNGNGYTIPREW